jgi:hypothetical protein
METSKATYQHLLQQFLTLASDTGVGSAIAAESDGSLPEILVQAIWRGQFLHSAQLRTLDGRTIEVLDPGRHQTCGPGPDFRSAHLLIAGQEVQGDIEIHTDAADWHRHGHDRDFEYNSVVLHVALHATDSIIEDCLQNGHRTPRLLLESVLDPDLPGALASARELLLSESADSPGNAKTVHGAGCRLAVEQMGPGHIRTLLARASDERLNAKIARLRTLGHGLNPSQILHQALLTSLGQKTAKTLYFLLSRRVPVDELLSTVHDVPPAEQGIAMEAILLGVANLLPPNDDTIRPDDEPAQAHAAAIRSWWAQYRGMFRDRILPPTRRWIGQTRPPGFPCRRIAAYAAILARAPASGLLGDLVLTRIRSLATIKPSTARAWKAAAHQASRWMVVTEHEYWDRHCSWGGKPLPHRVALLGDDQADAMAFNALLPWSLLQAENTGDGHLAQFLRDLYTQFPSLPANAVTRYMENRLFGGKAPPDIPMKLERYRQGLLQMFADCCDHPAFGQCTMRSGQVRSDKKAT